MRSATVRPWLQGIGSSNQERSCGGSTADESGLVSGVEIGVISVDPGGVGEQLEVGVGPTGLRSLSADSEEMLNLDACMPVVSFLPFSKPKKSGGLVRQPLPVRCLWFSSSSRWSTWGATSYCG